MSYGFLIFKPKIQINSQHDLSEETVELQHPDHVMRALSELLPSLSWSRIYADSFWEALTEDDHGRYEFHVGPEIKEAWSINTSHRTTTRSLIPRICKALGVIAFDGQAMKIIDENGERPA